MQDHLWVVEMWSEDKGQWLLHSTHQSRAVARWTRDKFLFKDCGRIRKFIAA